MVNIVDVVPGSPAEAQILYSDINKDRRYSYSQVSHIDKQKQNSRNAFAPYVKETTWKSQ